MQRDVRNAALKLALWNGLALLLVLLAADAAFYLVAVGGQRDQLAELAGTPAGDAAIRSFARTLLAGIALANVPILAAAAAAAYALGRAAVAPLAEALERQRRFAAQASHELRTPISVIAAQAEVALRAGDHAQAREALESILEEARRMGRLASDLLTLARASSELGVHAEPVDLEEVAAATVRRFAQRAQAAGVRLLREGNGFAPVLGDRDRLLELAGNLVANALHATPSGGSITVAVRSDRGQALLEVRDTGTGIPRERLSDIFEPFVRLAPSSDDGDGAGLGLAICRWIAAAHHGTIGAASEAGAGSAFTVRLPLHGG